MKSGSESSIVKPASAPIVPLVLAFGSGAEEERAGFAPASAADARIARFRVCHYPPARHMLARIQ